MLLIPPSLSLFVNWRINTVTVAMGRENQLTVVSAERQITIVSASCHRGFVDRLIVDDFSFSQWREPWDGNVMAPQRINQQRRVQQTSQLSLSLYVFIQSRGWMVRLLMLFGSAPKRKQMTRNSLQCVGWCRFHWLANAGYCSLGSD